MRILVALGGNALLKRGEPMTAEAERANVHQAALARPDRRAPSTRFVARQRPAVGLLLQASAYKDVEAHRSTWTPRTGNGRLPDRAGARQPRAQGRPSGHHPDDDRSGPRRPGIRKPDKVCRASLRRRRRRRAGRRKGLDIRARRQQATACNPVSGAKAHLWRCGQFAGCLTTAPRDLYGRGRGPDRVGSRRRSYARGGRGGNRQGPGQRAPCP